MTHFTPSEQLLLKHCRSDDMLFEAWHICANVHIRPIMLGRDFTQYQVNKEVWTFDLVKRVDGTPEFKCLATNRQPGSALDIIMHHTAAQAMLAIREYHKRGTIRRQNARDRREHAEELIPY